MQKLIGRFVLLILFVTMVAACGHRGKHHSANLTPEQIEKRALDRTGWFLDDIDATDAQRADVEAVVKRTLPTLLAMRAKKGTYKERALRAVQAKAPDEKALRSLVDEATTDFRGAAHTLTDAVLEVHAVLTPEQRGTLIERAEDAAEGRRKPPTWMFDAVVNRALDELEASDKQSELVLDHKERVEKKVSAMRGQRDATRKFALEQLGSAKPDAAALHKRVDGLVDGGASIGQTAVGAVVAILPTLTASQRLKIAEHMAERRRH